MDIGTGIAIAGVWVFVGLTSLSSTVSGIGWLISIAIAIITTGILY